MPETCSADLADQ